MKRSELVKQLKKAGWRIEHGGKHDMAKHPSRKGKLPIPRHNEIDEYTARGILKDAGIE